MQYDLSINILEYTEVLKCCFADCSEEKFALTPSNLLRDAGYGFRVDHRLQRDL